MSQEALSSRQLLASLRWRYATKSFDPARKIPAGLWAVLEECLVLAPSSFGLQPYRFLVVEDRTVREKLLPQAWGQRQVVEASHFVVFAARTEVTEAEIDGFLRHTARVRAKPVESLAGYRGMMTGTLLSEGFRLLAPHWTVRQAYLALGSLLSCAALLGVDACPMEGFVPAEFDRILGLTGQGLRSAVACALGYRSPGDKYASAPKVRFPRSQLVRTI
ncbi:MAG: NAD(P)H-dependent oxidoreductase [Verrucomicrobiota bacterium]|jgi:nitroreductase